ncbi:MAG: DUF2065 domain-containing protein [Alphaproteobacteria bacterium]
MWQELGIALGLVLVIEGILYALAPDWMRRMLHMLLSQSTESIRISGIAAALLGVVIVWLVQ